LFAIIAFSPYVSVVKIAGTLLGIAFTALSLPALAEEGAMSPWSQTDHAALRLIAGPTAASGKQRVGIEIKLTPGYKTYWRNPGDSGVPPAFDWSGSTNVAGLDVRWPVPERFIDSTGHSIGYVEEVVLPISVQPLDAAQPVMLVLKLDYAICEKICIPVKSEARLWLEPGVTNVTSARLEQFEARVPVPAKLGEHKQHLSLADAQVDATGAKPELALTIRLPGDGKVEDVFVEGAGMWSFGKPNFSPQPDGTVLARIKVRDRPKGAAGPTPIIVTLRGQPGPSETRLELDIPAGRP
jgi:DsbC/DsbD-like thiol-disulfide interchange protein